MYNCEIHHPFKQFGVRKLYKRKTTKFMIIFKCIHANFFIINKKFFNKIVKVNILLFYMQTIVTIFILKFSNFLLIITIFYPWTLINVVVIGNTFFDGVVTCIIFDVFLIQIVQEEKKIKCLFRLIHVRLFIIIINCFYCNYFLLIHNYLKQVFKCFAIQKFKIRNYGSTAFLS